MKIPISAALSLSIAVCALSISAQEIELSRSISPPNLIVEPLESNPSPNFIVGKTRNPRIQEPVPEWGSRPGDRKFARRRVPFSPTYYYTGPSHGPEDPFNFVPVGGLIHPGGRRHIVNPDSSVTFLD